MFILDASTLIAIFVEAERPDIVDGLLEIDPDLVIPSNLFSREIVGAVVRVGVDAYVAAGKIRVLHANTMKEIDEFSVKVEGHKNLRVKRRKKAKIKRLKNLKYGLGEIDVMLTYKKYISRGHMARCVLDDRRARGLASRLGIEFTGLLGLLDDLRDMGIMDGDAIEDIKSLLKSRGFRMKGGAR